ncbi:DUF721 domain-containing protein [Roseovarius aestuariivivens]|uniref:DUF721 domain-containing protein n=1 Tax=Roseovarius aestuariivivens TaxID=1888910 RepID=UPI00107FE310|nr:DciA family protein [Roseovarius aestuariivivens]
MPAQKGNYKGTTKGFKRSGTLLGARIREASEKRGFAVSRVLTQWSEIAGADLAAISRPVKISYGRQGLGATLTVLTTGAQAPVLDMQKEKLRERVNAAYGYNAISRIHITQTAPTGFADGQASFEHRPVSKPAPQPDPATVRKVTELAEPVGDDDLRAALETLGRNVLSRTKR